MKYRRDMVFLCASMMSFAAVSTVCAQVESTSAEAQTSVSVEKGSEQDVVAKESGQKDMMEKLSEGVKKGLDKFKHAGAETWDHVKTRFGFLKDPAEQKRDAYHAQAVSHFNRLVEEFHQLKIRVLETTGADQRLFDDQLTTLSESIRLAEQQLEALSKQGIDDFDGYQKEVDALIYGIEQPIMRLEKRVALWNYQRRLMALKRESEVERQKFVDKIEQIENEYAVSMNVIGQEMQILRSRIEDYSETKQERWNQERDELESGFQILERDYDRVQAWLTKLFAVTE